MQVSAGYDAHWRDPLAGLQFRTSTFHYLAAQVKNLANAVAGKSATVVAQLVTHACSLVLRTYTVPIKMTAFCVFISQYHCTWIQDWCQCHLCLAATFICVLLLLSPWLVLLVLKVSAICRGPMCISAGRRL